MLKKRVLVKYIVKPKTLICKSLELSPDQGPASAGPAKSVKK
jgi:hypothetical protein